MPDFPYINARVRAMRSRLLAPSQIEDLLTTPTMPAFLQALAATPYSGDLQEALTRYDGVRAVDEALARNLQRTTRAILGFADGPAQRLIKVILLRWDVANLRVLARGKHAGRPAEEIAEAFMPAGTLSEVVLKEMAGFPDLNGVTGTLEAINHPFAGAMAEAVAAYGASKDLTGLELRLDRAYVEYGLNYTGGRGANARALRQILQAEVDVANIKTALRVAAAGGLGEEQRLAMFIPGGALVSADMFLGLSAPETQARAWRTLRVSGFPVREVPPDLVAFEREIDLIMIRSLAGHYRGDPLGLDLVVGYLAMKSAEVANLRLIARARFLGLPREQARRELVLV